MSKNAKRVSRWSMKNINESMNQYNKPSNNGQLYGYYEEALQG